MTATTTYTPSDYANDADIVALLSGFRWADSALPNLTYSFPTDPSCYGGGYGSGEATGFSEVTNSVKAGCRAAMRMITENTNAVLTEVFEALTYPAGIHADIRFGHTSNTNGGNTSWGNLPSSSPEGGDVWFHNFTEAEPGSYGWFACLHESGHAVLGFKHPHEVQGSAPNQFPIMASPPDAFERTNMSYRSFYGGPINSLTVDSYPMMYGPNDLRSMQAIYGVNSAFNATPATYTFDPATGVAYRDGVAITLTPFINRIQLCIWSANNANILDVSNYTGPQNINLNRGQTSTFSSAQVANLGGSPTHDADGNLFNPLDKDVWGSIKVSDDASNTLVFNSNLVSVPGRCKLIVPDVYGAYTKVGAGNSWAISKAGKTNTCTNLRYVQFADQLRHVNSLNKFVAHWP